MVVNSYIFLSKIEYFFEKFMMNDYSISKIEMNCQNYTSSTGIKGSFFYDLTMCILKRS